MILTPLAACGKSPPKAAAPDVQAVLGAIWAGDAKAFEAHLDRPAARADMRQQMIGVGRQNGLDLGGPSDFALDRMIGPDAVHLARNGAPLAGPPAADQVTAQLKAIDKSRVCLHDLSPQQKCLLTFAKEAAGWKLVSLPANHPTIELAPAAKP